MRTLQHIGARAILKILEVEIRKPKSDLTYTSAAIRLGRPANHARAVAQMCDLLDAAAALAGVPLLALTKVKELSGEINPKAWKEETAARRAAIIRKSESHKFAKADFNAIRAAIDALGERGNVKAWEYVNHLFPNGEVFLRITQTQSNLRSDAINDLGTDQPDRTSSVVVSYARNPQVRAEVLRRAMGRCEYCGVEGFLKPDGSRYLETHHIIALANEGSDRVSNVIALCPNDHREAHFGERASKIEEDMIETVKAIAKQASTR